MEPDFPLPEALDDDLFDAVSKTNTGALNFKGSTSLGVYDSMIQTNADELNNVTAHLGNLVISSWGIKHMASTWMAHGCKTDGVINAHATTIHGTDCFDALYEKDFVEMDHHGKMPLMGSETYEPENKKVHRTGYYLRYMEAPIGTLGDIQFNTLNNLVTELAWGFLNQDSGMTPTQDMRTPSHVRRALGYQHLYEGVFGVTNPRSVQYEAMKIARESVGLSRLADAVTFKISQAQYLFNTTKYHFDDVLNKYLPDPGVDADAYLAKKDIIEDVEAMMGMPFAQHILFMLKNYEPLPGTLPYHKYKTFNGSPNLLEMTPFEWVTAAISEPRIRRVAKLLSNIPKVDENNTPYTAATVSMLLTALDKYKDAVVELKRKYRIGQLYGYMVPYFSERGIRGYRIEEAYTEGAKIWHNFSKTKAAI